MYRTENLKKVLWYSSMKKFCAKFLNIFSECELQPHQRELILYYWNKILTLEITILGIEMIVKSSSKGWIFSEKYWYYFHCPKNVRCSIPSFVF
jgi:hypothetical protein